MTKEEAIEVYNGLINPKIKEAFEFFVPELCESEDEKFQKYILEACKECVEANDKGLELSMSTTKKLLSYLEKQKEQKSLNISAASEWLRKHVCNYRNSEYNEFHKCVEYDGSIDKERLINDFEEAMQKEQKPILEVFGFKVGDAVRLKDGDGRKHIIKSFEEVEGVHGPNFYHVEFEDDSASDGIYPGEEYPNGYYTQMEKFEEEQKPAENNVIIPQFHVGDYIKSKTYNEEHLIKDINKNGYVLDIDMVIPFKDEDMWVVDKKSTEWSDEEKDKLNRIERLIVNANAHGNSLIGDKEAIELQHFIHSLVNPITNIAEWSENDKRILNELLDHCNTENAAWYNFLKSLRPPLKDREMKLKILKYLSTRCSSLEFEEVEDYLNNLRPSWKPSEEQIMALRYYLNHVPYSLHKEHLSSLRDECEKLFIQ